MQTIIGSKVLVKFANDTFLALTNSHTHAPHANIKKNNYVYLFATIFTILGLPLIIFEVIKHVWNWSYLRCWRERMFMPNLGLDRPWQVASCDIDISPRVPYRLYICWMYKPKKSFECTVPGYWWQINANIAKLTRTFMAAIHANDREIRLKQK